VANMLLVSILLGYEEGFTKAIAPKILLDNVVNLIVGKPMERTV